MDLHHGRLGTIDRRACAVRKKITMKKKAFVALICGMALAVPFHMHGGTTTVSAAPALEGGCPPPAKAYKCHQSVAITSTGSFQIQLSGTSVRLKGYATRSAYRSQVYLARVSVRNAPRRGTTFKIFATKHFPSLYLATKGTLYRYYPARNTWRKVSSALSTGIYAAVLR
jgi:hypothetical protein